MTGLHNKLYQSVLGQGGMREALFLPREVEDFPEIAAQGQQGKEDNGTPGGAENWKWGCVSDDVNLQSLGQRALYKAQQWFGTFYSYKVCLIYGWKVLD